MIPGNAELLLQQSGEKYEQDSRCFWSNLMNTVSLSENRERNYGKHLGTHCIVTGNFLVQVDVYLYYNLQKFFFSQLIL